MAMTSTTDKKTGTDKKRRDVRRHTDEKRWRKRRDMRRHALTREGRKDEMTGGRN